MLRKEILVGLALVVFSLLLTGRPAFAEDDASHSSLESIRTWDISVGAGVDFYSKYIWRGQNLVDEPVLQPSAYVGIENFTASVWGNYALTDDEDWTELDYTFDYTTSLAFVSPKLEKLSVSFGYIYYDFPHLPPNNDSQEVYAAIAADTLLSPSLAVYHDYDQGDGTYYEFSVAHSMPIEPLSLNLCATVGYNDGQWDFDSSFSNALLGASLTIPLTERIAFEPGIFYSAALDSQYDDEFYGGFSMSVEY